MADRPCTLRVVLGDQLSTRLAIIKDADRDRDVILMAEVMAEATYVNHHVKKIAFLFSAMRHLAAALRKAGFTVRYITLDDPDNSHTLTGEILRAVHDLADNDLAFDRIHITEPGEWRLRQALEDLTQALAIPLVILPDTRFLCSHAEFDRWADDRQDLRLEYFYRLMRRTHAILLEPDGRPAGGQWNFDTDNRKPPPKGLTSPPRLAFRIDAITRDVLDLVARRFPDGFGELEPFHFSVTRTQALRELDHFVTHILPSFGAYQDVMVAGQPYLYHSLLSTYLNAGLLYPLEMCHRAEAAWRAGHVPLSAAEGFIRQILGWREYIRGVYWRYMPGYRDLNVLDAREPLPWFYWSGETRMNCVRHAVADTRAHAYSHHIQRLMVTGNFALLAGLDPAQVHDWYLSVYADAYEWVELPNTLGMALHADGGRLASKPYAASGNYINRMSTFCNGCAYDPKVSTGDTACPFNALYWDFIARHEDRFRPNGRMPFVYASWDRMAPDRQDALRAQAARHLTAMREGRL